MEKFIVQLNILTPEKEELYLLFSVSYEHHLGDMSNGVGPQDEFVIHTPIKVKSETAKYINIDIDSYYPIVSIYAILSKNTYKFTELLRDGQNKRLKIIG